MSIMRIITFTFVLLAAALVVPGANPATPASSNSIEINAGSVRTIATAGTPAAQSIIVVPEPFVVAPGQPAPQPRSTVGLINALCDVTLNIVGCGFMPTEITLACDADADLVPDLVIPLKDITLVNHLLIQARLPALAPHLSGSPFPLSCCGGAATLTLTRKVGAGDDNIFGPFIQSISVPIDLGTRAPVVLSASPSGGNCSVGQNLLIPGSCFVVEGNKPNVTSVFAVDRDNPNNVIQAAHFAIMNANLIDAYFEFGSSNAGKTFLIFVSGPNGTSRNLTALPDGAPFGCPIGNETGIVITFTCDGASPPGTGDTPGTPDSDPVPIIVSCQLDRDSSGAFTLTMRVAGGIPNNSIVTIGGLKPKKVRFKDPEPGSSPIRYTRVVLKGRICNGLPGQAAITIPGGPTLLPFNCNSTCSN